VWLAAIAFRAMFRMLPRLDMSGASVYEQPPGGLHFRRAGLGAIGSLRFRDAVKSAHHLTAVRQRRAQDLAIHLHFARQREGGSAHAVARIAKRIRHAFAEDVVESAEAQVLRPAHQPAERAPLAPCLTQRDEDAVRRED